MSEPVTSGHSGSPAAVARARLDDLQHIQRRRKQIIRLGAVALLALAVTSQAVMPPDSLGRDMIEGIGIAAIVLCIFGRGWCALYIGGRKKTELVMTGPYSMCRNPLYVFSIIGAFGAGAQSGSIMMALIFAIGCWWVFRSVVRHEERLLRDRFGVLFARYENYTPRFCPTWYRWQDEETLVCHPSLYLCTMRDALWFLISVPVFAGVKLMQEQGWVTPLIMLP